MPTTVILIGPMGAGKSSIGRRLAKLLDLPFRDMDQVIRERAGVDIDFIFEKEGEAGFRRREEKILAELLNSAPAVIATGGGIVLSERNRALLHAQEVVVFLETDVEWQFARTQHGTHRPLLATADRRDRLATLYNERLPLYRACASITVSTNGRRVSTVATAVLNELQKSGSQEARQ